MKAFSMPQNTLPTVNLLFMVDKILFYNSEETSYVEELLLYPYY
jgi:hypothetical protein